MPGFCNRSGDVYMIYKYGDEGDKVLCPKCGRHMLRERIRCAFCGERLTEFFNVQCKTCGAQVPVRNAYDASKGDEAFLYCDKDSTALIWCIYDREYIAVSGGGFPWNLTQEARDEIERHLIECPCGGRFLFKNTLKCPVCGGVFSRSISHASEDVIIMDRHIDGNETRIWKD